MSDTLRTDAFAKTKWNWRNPSVDRASVERSINNASNWTNGHMYRTSYHDMSDKVRLDLFSAKSMIYLTIILAVTFTLCFILFRNLCL